MRVRVFNAGDQETMFDLVDEMARYHILFDI